MSDEQEVTTVMVRNVPSHVKQSAFVKELEDYDFGGTFDFCYLPSAFDTGKNKGYAFVNFVSETAYSAFVKAWHGSRRFNVRVSDPALNVSAAALQGLERNIEKWDAPRMRRVRNPEFRPFVLKSAKKADAAKANVNHDRSVPTPSRLPSNASAEMPPPPGLSPPPGLVL
jgi:RNA recognition motif-containing protein